uniref:Uncharacterized protein n=1 Tax=Ananas comosus var. bracteatus TaxID=296719 RepID=A0A6V7QZ61_ANACO
MLSEARSLPCFHLVFDVATFESSIGSVKLDLEYSKYSRSSLTEPIDDSKVVTSKTSWKHGRLRASDSISRPPQHQAIETNGEPAIEFQSRDSCATNNMTIYQ